MEYEKMLFFIIGLVVIECSAQLTYCATSAYSATALSEFKGICAGTNGNDFSAYHFSIENDFTVDKDNINCGQINFFNTIKLWSSAISDGTVWYFDGNYVVFEEDSFVTIYGRLHSIHKMTFKENSTIILESDGQLSIAKEMAFDISHARINNPPIVFWTGTYLHLFKGNSVKGDFFISNPEGNGPTR